MNKTKLHLSQNLLPERLDILITNLSGKTRSNVQRLIKDGAVELDGNVILEPKFKVKNQCDIEFIDLPKPSEHIFPKKIDLNIIYEDSDILVINKQANLTVHPGIGNYDDTLVNGLKFYLDSNLSNINGKERPGIVHRLDRDTSGLMVIAKNDEAHVQLSNDISERLVKRKYKALVFGVPKPVEGVINTLMGRSPKDRTKMAVLKIGGKDAITKYKVLEIFTNGLFSLVECRLETGRTHQIRVHMTHIRHSILGDREYGKSKSKIDKLQNGYIKDILNTINRQSLHAYYLGFKHPISKKEMEFEIDLPQDINYLVENLRMIS